MPAISEEIQDTLWKIGDALAQALSDLGDPTWRVTGLGSKAWKVSHPELPVVKDDQGIQKDVLLQMHLQEDEDAGRWFVIAQNKVVGPDSHSSPRLYIVADEDQPPNDSWPIEEIAQAASNFFQKQKDLLVQEAQASSPQVPYNSGPPQGAAAGPPGLGGPLASRRKKIASQIFACPTDQVVSGSSEDDESDEPEVAAGDHITNWLGEDEDFRRASRKAESWFTRDDIPGGLADDKNPTDYDPEEIQKGTKVELEHTDDPGMALDIAMDHLEESNDYYTRLNKMEKEASLSPRKRRAKVARKIWDLVNGPEEEGDIDPDFGWDPRSGIADDFVGGND